ncbi:MAG: hypothetical protein K2K74_10005 [Lachnospiraceae bacterium]|nr:hypothetical protein [Lachnospiraceae bacterium]
MLRVKMYVTRSMARLRWRISESFPELSGKRVYQKKVCTKNLREEEWGLCKGMTDEEMEEKRFISYKKEIEKIL